MLDLGAVVSVDELEVALHSALRQRLSSSSSLRSRVAKAGTKGRSGAARLLSLVDALEHQRPLDSGMEVRLKALIADHQLPMPRWQFVIEREDRRARLDAAWAEAKVALEADGYAWHSSKVQWQKDLDRRSWLASLGWLVIHVSWKDIDQNPSEVVARVRAALRSRGAT